jgi:uncharacterized iron-regulated membrane protein
MKIFFRRIHLYLGLASGLLILVVCFTGGILVFEKELEQVWHSERYFVTPATTPRLSLAQLTDVVKAAKPKGKISSFKVYSNPTRTVEVNLAGDDKGGKGGPQGGPSGKPGQPEQRAENRSEVARGQRGNSDRAEARGPMGGGAGEKGGPGGKGGKGRNVGPRLFVNPYTGAVIDEINPRETFFHFMEEIHRGLVAGRTGKLIMGINSIVFLFILGTGIVLWWPTARKNLTQRLKVKWGSSWKRLNHDFHIVLGFYTSIFLLIMALTGVGMSFDWVGNTINTLTNSPKQRPEPPTSTVPTAGGATFGVDAALLAAQRQIPAAVSYSVQVPKEPTGSIQVGMLRPDALTERATDDVYFDQYSGQVLRQTTYGQQPVGQRIRGLFKPIHTGAIFGWPTKILSFVIICLGFSFPITGTILWWNRTNKAKKKPRKMVAA